MSKNMDLLDKLYYYIEKFQKKIDFIPYDKWYYRILNMFYFPLRFVLIFLIYYVFHCIFSFVVLFYWIIKGET